MAVPMTAMHNDDTVSDDELCDSYVADQREITRLHASAHPSSAAPMPSST